MFKEVYVFWLDILIKIGVKLVDFILDKWTYIIALFWIIVFVFVIYNDIQHAQECVKRVGYWNCVIVADGNFPR